MSAAKRKAKKKADPVVGERPGLRLTAEEWSQRISILRVPDDVRHAAAARVYFDEADEQPGDWHSFHEQWLPGPTPDVDRAELVRVLRRLSYRREVAEDLPPDLSGEPDLDAIRAAVMG